MEYKLRVSIRLDVDASVARVEVRGRVNERNAPVLYVLAKRAHAAVPGLRIVLDLRRASICEEALRELCQSCETGLFPLPDAPAFAPRQLSVLAPAA